MGMEKGKKKKCKKKCGKACCSDPSPPPPPPCEDKKSEKKCKKIVKKEQCSTKKAKKCELTCGVCETVCADTKTEAQCSKVVAKGYCETSSRHLVHRDAGRSYSPVLGSARASVWFGIAAVRAFCCSSWCCECCGVCAWSVSQSVCVQ